MTVQEMKTAVCAAIDNNREKILALGDAMYHDAETGYREYRTAAKIQAALDEAGLEHQDGVAMTGILTPFKGRDHKVHISLMGELDGLIVPSHPCAVPETGMAHACGHSIQAAALVGVAYALKESGVMNYLDGDITLMHVPAEEMVELEYRKELVEQGKIKLYGGKQEFIRLGVMDDVDIMIMQHTAITEGPENEGVPKADCGGISKGFVAKLVQYIGKEAHGARPHEGINALKAAYLGLSAIDANRDTFLEKDGIRVHPIITKGGTLVNVVPADVRLETFVRGYSMEAIQDASFKVDRALRSGAYAVGAECVISELPGYIVPVESNELKDVVFENLKDFFGADKVAYTGPGGSSDASDVSVLMPTVMLWIGGASGVHHGANFEIVDPEMAYITAAKVLACVAIDLLANGAEKGLHVKNSFHAPMTKDEYLTQWCHLEKGKDF